MAVAADSGVTFGSKENAFSLLDKTSGDRSLVARVQLVPCGLRKIGFVEYIR